MKYKYLLQNTYEQISSSAPTTVLASKKQSVHSPPTLDEEGGSSPKMPSVRHDSPTKRNLLGDFTIYRIHKEFENF